MVSTTQYISPIGPLMLAADESGIVGLWIEGQKYFGQTLPKSTVENDALPLFGRVKDWLNRYFAGDKPDVSELPLAPVGGAFRQAVWAILCEIPYGEITTYGEIARKIAARSHRDSMSAQAVGGAVGHNPISILIPCHRVVGTGGSLTGYAGGIQKKLRLLELEGVDISKLSIPKKRSAL